MNFDDQITLLGRERLLGSRKLDIMKKYGNAAAITDFAILLGGFVSRKEYYTSDGNNLEDRACDYWTRTPLKAFEAIVVLPDGFGVYQHFDIRSSAIRPALHSLSIFKEPNRIRGKSGVLEVEYGEYPQQAVQESLNRTLESKYQIGRLYSTGKEYTTDSRNLNEFDKDFKAAKNIEYEYIGKKYVRVVAKLNTNSIKLSNGVSINSGDAIWVEVEPIKWLIDEKEHIALSKKCLVAGIKFYKSYCSWDGCFDNTEINQFLQKYFKKEMVPSVVHTMIPGEIKNCEQRQKEILNMDGKDAFVKNQQVEIANPKGGEVIYIDEDMLDRISYEQDNYNWQKRK